MHCPAGCAAATALLLLSVASSSALAQREAVPPPPSASSTDLAYDPRALSDPSGPEPARTVTPYELPRVDEVLVLPFAADHLVLHYRRASDEPFRPVCTAPCRATLLQDRYQLAIAPPEHYPRIVGRAFEEIRPGDVLQLHHQSRADVRTAGWIVLTGAATALAGSAASLNLLILLIIGVPIAAFLFVIALPMVAMMDHASVEIRPIPEALVRP